MSGVFKKTKGYLFCFAFLAVLVFGVSGILSRMLGISYPMAAIASDSMLPTLKIGDMVLIRGLKDGSEVEQGDIIVYKNGKDFAIHRVAKVGKNVVFARGDANPEIDWLVRPENIIGKALEFGGKPVKIPYLGNIGIFLSKNGSS